MSAKVAVVTGAASGIGRALARRFAADGLIVVAADIEPAPLAELNREFGLFGVVTDVADEGSVQSLAETVMDRFGRVDVVCSNAGVVGGAGSLQEVTAADWRWVLEVNVLGAVHGIQAFLPHLIANPEGGHLLTTASEAALLAMPMLAHYSASKAALCSLTESVAVELAAAGHHHVHVHAVLPGPVRTRLGETARHRPARYGPPRAATRDREILDQIVATAIEPEDVVEAAMRGMAEGRFWIFTDPAPVDAVRARADAINSAMRLAQATSAG